MILFCFISLLGTASAEEIIDNNIASNDASIDIDVIESPIHEDISISTVKNSDVSTDDSSTVNGSASKGKLTANKLSADHTFTGSTFDDLQSFLNSGNVNDGDTVYLGGIDLTSSWQAWQGNTINVNVNNLKIMGGTSDNPNGFSTLNGNGACIFKINAPNVSLYNIKFVNSGHNGDKGSAINIQDTGCTIVNCSFDNCKSTDGGAIYSSGSNTIIIDSNFTNNEAVYNHGDGGAVYLASGDCQFTNCIFTDNHATNYGDGGAISISGDGETFNFTNCIFRGNDGGTGGAIYGGRPKLTLTDCVFEDNKATNGNTGGGAVAIYHDDATITNSNFTNNDAAKGGAIYIMDDCHNADMTGCNFTGNTATSGKAIYCDGSGDGKVTDCDFGIKPELNVNNGYPTLTLTLTSDYASIIVGNIEGGPSGGSTVPEANETITLEIFDSTGTRVATVTGKTDEKGQMKYDYSHLPRGNYTYKATYMDGQTKEGPLNMGVVEGDNFSAIQAAIDAAEPGSVIFLEGKTYYNDIPGTMTINKPITIIGTDGTVLDAENISRIFTIADNIDNVNLNNITFINGFVEDGDGGAIYVSQGSDNLNLVNCNFTNNHATGEDSQGGALFIAGGANNGNIINTTFDNNTADIDGGAIRNDGGWGWNIYNTSFTHNSAVIDGDSDEIHWGGGAIWTCNAPMTIYNSNFTENNGTYGGAIRGAVSTYECLFDNNTATNGNGGAIDVTTDEGLYDQIDLEFVNTTFINNDAKGSRGQDRAQGGGIHIYHLKEIDMYGCYCENNTADRGGAIDFYELERTHVENCTILNNNASSEGGGMAIFCNQSTFKDTNVSNNNAGTDGGAIWVIGHNALFDNITSINNTAERGGSSFINGSDTVIVNCNITNNTAVFNPSKPDDSGLGGAIDVIGDNCRIINLTSEDNNAYRGGSTFIRGDNTIVYNSTFDNNNATLRGGGLNIAGDGCIVENVTANNNNAGLMGGGIYVVANGTHFKNITADNNQAERGGGAFIAGNDVTIDIGDFSNNKATFNESNPEYSGLGGALDIAGDGCNITNVNSTNNQAYRGGSTFIRGDNTFVANCSFDNNNATLRGGGLNIAGDGVIVENVTANNNNASLMGGGIYVVANGTHFKNITADNNQAERGGGAFIQGNDVTIDIGDFSNNKATFNESNPEYSGLGGALDIAGNGCNVTNVNSTGNTAYRGGSTFIRGNDTHVENCKLDDNNATLRGGGLNIAGERCTIDNVEINNNNAGTMGGGIYVVSNGTTFTNIVADNNQAERGGAAFINGTNILVQHGELNNNLARFNESKENESGLGGGFDIVGDNVTVDDVHSNNNQAYRGGSTFIRGNNVTVSNCNLDNNNATVRGGALNIGGGDNCKVINVSVSNNKAGEDGGAIYVIGNYSLFDNVNSTNNTAERGGSSFVAGDYINVTNCNLNNNNATIRGGGMDVAGSNCIFENVSLSNCNANGTDFFDGGGGLYVVGEDNRFTNITAENNTAIHYGGSIYVGGDNNLVENSTIHNSSAWNGGGITVVGANSKFFNNNITENHAIVTLNDTFHDYLMQGGGAFIMGSGTNFTNNNISSNTAIDNGGGVAVFLGSDTYFENIYAENNNASNGGFGKLNMAHNMTVVNSTFYNNHATGDISDYRGEGGAFHLSYSTDIDIQGNFSYNTATNGSAIYLDGSSLKVHDSDFFDNQAHTYYLLIIPEENTTYNKGEDVVINITHIGGDNIANAIYNAHGEPGNENIKIKNITYPFYNNGILENKTISPDGYVSPVDGYENSDNGKLIYLDDSEDNQVIYYNITNKDTGESKLVGFNRTEISGTVSITLKNLPVGNYTVRAHYPETTYYTEISNETVFRVVNNDEPELNITKVANDQIVYVGNQTSFTIVVNNTGNHNLSEIVVTDKDFSQGLDYDHYTNGSGQWDYIGNSQWKLVGDLNVNETANFTVFFNVTLNGTLTNNVSVVSNETGQTNATNYTTAYKPNMTVVKIANDEVVYVGNQTSFTIVVTNTGDCNLTGVVVTDTDFTKPGLVYDHYANSSRQWTYDGNGQWTLVNALLNGTSANFTVYFNVTANGTLVNNVSAVSNLTNETNATNQTRAYRPNMTVQKIANDNVTYVGNQTSFTIVVTNTGDCNLTDVVVTDTDFTKPGLVYDHYTNSSRQWTYDGNGQWTLVNALLNGTSANFTVYFNVTANGTLVNNVSAVSNLTNETNATNQTRAYRPNMTVVKIADDEVVYVGNQTSFTIVVTNTGDCNLTGVVVTDTDFTKPGLVYDHYANSSRLWDYDGSKWTLVNPLDIGASANFTVYFNVTTNGTLVNNVTAKSNLTNETNGTNETKAYAPNMTVRKITIDEIVYIGDQVRFTIVVNNTGDCDLNDVVVTDREYSNGLTYVRYENSTLSDALKWRNTGDREWTLDGILPMGGTAEFIVFFNVTEAGELINTVTAHSNLTNNTTGTNHTHAYGPSMIVIKVAESNITYVGGTTSFIVTVLNDGDVELGNVTVVDNDHPGLVYNGTYDSVKRDWTYDIESKTWTLNGALGVGDDASFRIYFNVTLPGILNNTATAKSNLTNETNGTNNTTAYVANMSVEKIADNEVTYVGNTTSFTIVVHNIGQYNLTNVTVTDKDYSKGLVFTGRYESLVGNWNYDAQSETWTLNGPLAVGGNASFRVYFNVTLNGTLENNVTAKSNETNETNATNETHAYAPNMTVQKIANDDIVYVGNVTSFDIVVSNTGDCNLTGVYVIDSDYSAGLKFLKYENGSREWNYDGAKWTLVGDLNTDAPAASLIVYFTVIGNGTLVNNVSASSNLTNETNGTNNTTAKAPNMTVQKISIDKVVPVGNSSRFEIVVSNTGDCELSDIYVIDTDHDEGLVYVKYENGTRTWNYDGNGRWDLVGPLGIGKNASFIIYFNVTANGTLRNNVTAGSNLTNETNGTNVTTSLVPNMTIEKIANQKVIYVGNTTSFTIIVRNTGEANLTNILVTDKDYSEGLVFNGVYEPVKGDWTYNGDNTWSLASLNLGEDASFTLYFNVTANGTLVNNASAHSDLTNETNATNDTRAYQPNMTVKKLIYDDVVYVGDLAIFTIMVYNTGDCNLSNVTVKETWFSEGLVFDDWVPNGNYLWDFNEDEMTWTMKGILPPFENNIASLVVFFNVTQNGTLKNNVSASSNLTNETNSSNETHAYDPKLTVEKIANDDVVYVGNTTSFTIVVTNTGDCELSEIVVTDDKYSDGLEYSKYENSSRLWNYVDGKWNLDGSLAPGESANLTVFFTVISNGTLNNTATAVSNLTNETNSTNNTTAYKPDITVLKIANDDVVYVGNVTSFTILVINTGDCDLSGIYVIDDDYSDGLKYNRYENGTGKWTYDGERFTLVGDLAAGESADFTVFFDVVENGTLVNNVSAGSNLTNETNNTNNTTAKPVCDVIIYKEVNTTECLVGDLVEWTITVVNVGPSTALDVIVKDVLSKDLELVSASSTSYNNATGEWTVGDLKVNTPVSLTLVTRVLASGTIYNNATVNTTTDESNYTNNNASNKTDAKVLCDLIITKAVNQSSCNVSDIIQWNVTVTNLGPHSASDVIVKDLLPDGLELISYNVSIGNFNDVIGEWSVGTLDKDQIESLILVTKVLVNGTIVNIATVNTTTPDLDYTNNEANNTTVAENICDLEVIKIVNSKKVYIGDLLTWTIRVTNNGPSEALDVCVSDILPEGLIFVNYKATTGKYDDVSGTWTVGKLASGSSATLDLITRIDELGNITNPVSVNTTTPESNYSNNKANNTTEAIPIVDLVLDKSSDKAKYNVNDTMHWIIKVTNRGPCDAIDAYVLDVLPKGTKFISYEATKGTYDETTGVWSIGDIANGEEVSIDILCKALLSGNFTNNATVYNNVTDTNTSNNYDNSTVEIIEDTPEPGPNPEPVPDEPIPNEPPVTTMLKTGNPLVVLLLALIAMAGTLGLRRRKE